MLTIVLIRSVEFAKKQIYESNQYAKCFELRLDTFPASEYDSLRPLIELFKNRPYILTLRNISHGGKFSNDQQKKVDTLKAFSYLSPNFIDLECSMEKELVYEIKKTFPKAEIIGSIHKFDSVTYSLDTLLNEGFHFDPDIYKLALYCHNACDAINLMNFTKKVNLSGKKIIGVPIGDNTLFSRVLSPIYLNPIHFASSSEDTKVATGQLSAKELEETYHFSSLSEKTKIYALIGSPVSQSPSHKSHNKAFKLMNKDAVYVKINLDKTLLETFLQNIQSLGFEGLSVTIPFKEICCGLSLNHEELVSNIGSLNTIKRIEDQWHTTNTDGKAASKLISDRIDPREKKIIILGTGGTAKSIGYELKKLGAFVTAISQSLYKKDNFNIACFDQILSYDELSKVIESDCNILINATPVCLFNKELSPINEEYLKYKPLVLDVTLAPYVTKIIKDAQNAGCEIISGIDLFKAQALLQFDYWFHSSPGERWELDRSFCEESS